MKMIQFVNRISVFRNATVSDEISGESCSQFEWKPNIFISNGVEDGVFSTHRLLSVLYFKTFYIYSENKCFIQLFESVKDK